MPSSSAYLSLNTWAGVPLWLFEMEVNNVRFDAVIWSGG